LGYQPLLPLIIKLRFDSMSVRAANTSWLRAVKTSGPDILEQQTSQ
jgi:hypothetical protein